MSPWGYVRGKRKNLCVVGDFEDVVKKEWGKEWSSAWRNVCKSMAILHEERLSRTDYSAILYRHLIMTPACEDSKGEFSFEDYHFIKSRAYFPPNS